MRKTILISSALIILALGMDSCKKCTKCTLTTNEVINSKDSTVVLTTEICNGKNGAGANYNVTIKDIEANGYLCTPE